MPNTQQPLGAWKYPLQDMYFSKILVRYEDDFSFTNRLLGHDDHDSDLSDDVNPLQVEHVHQCVGGGDIQLIQVEHPVKILRRSFFS